ncbi:hypothetical protein JYT72_03200 [Crocinitomix catalasitica]|nr:hypothetical protein [Crocinitomix catalasitica]
MYTQDWKVDTCSLKGSVESLVLKKNVFHDDHDFDWFESTYDYNRQGYLVRSNWSSSLWGVNHNTNFRIYDDSGIRCQKEYYIQDGDTASLWEFSYDSHGNLNKQNVYDHGNWGTDMISECIYYYNNKGLLIKELMVIQNSLDEHYRYYDYDADGRLIKDSKITPHKKSIKSWKHDEAGLLIEEKFLDTSWGSRSFYEKDSDGNFVQMRHQDNSEKPYTGESYVTTFSRNDLGQIIQEMKSEPKGKFISRRTYSYNEKGDELTEETLYKPSKDKIMPDKKFKGKFVYSYEYDLHGNWISKATELSGKLIERETREIEYY